MKTILLLLASIAIILFYSCSKDSNSIYGQVTYYDSTARATQPAGVALVQINSSGKNGHYYQVLADADGYYEIKSVYSGHYDITATFSPDGVKKYSGTATADLSYNQDKVVDIKAQ